ncbi:IS701 family transposase [Streptomyces sp. 2A115]|uniref:IS701 family transposase n=1 Tax=Streptomyces sp. 2A115 TaxID=3457439 RepID=UPI003FD3EC54
MTRHVRQSIHGRRESSVLTSLLTEVGTDLFASLQRNGHRLKAEQYVHGLLASSGRKTLRKIATQVDGAASQQSVHHFISASPWAWTPVRRALAHYVGRTLAPEAWVIRPTVIPKIGSHSVGVDQQYIPHLRQVVNSQQAVGTWMASSRAAVPVDWHLLLPPRWLEASLRRRASIPVGEAANTLEGCVRDAALNIASFAKALPGPVVVDAQGLDAVVLAHRFMSLGLVFLVRADRETRLRIDRSRLPMYGDAPSTAAQLARSLPQLLRPVSVGSGPTLAVAIPVTAVEPPRAPRGEGMMLLGEGSSAGQDDGGLWLTNARTASLSSLLRLTRLSGFVASDFAGIADGVGMRDFAGRSFQGWHHHTTLASVAHLIAVLQGEADEDACLARAAA